MFEGNYSIKYHLAPPLLSDRDANGHLVKQQFGSWVGKVFPVLAKFRFLRGTIKGREYVRAYREETRRRVYVEYLLLHELGHMNGFGHNFYTRKETDADHRQEGEAGEDSEPEHQRIPPATNHVATAATPISMAKA